VDEKRQDEFFGMRVMDFSTREAGRVKGMRVRMRR
jgi:hypothetical protein